MCPGAAGGNGLFEVTAVEPGATFYFNPIRKGSEASGESVRDLATSQPLPFEVVSGDEARASGLPEADPAGSYIRIQLPRLVPNDGGIRLLIEKTYKDPQSYRRKDSNRIVFSRTLGIRRNSIVLPAGYELIACNARWVHCPRRALNQEIAGRLKMPTPWMAAGAAAGPGVERARTGERVGVSAAEAAAAMAGPGAGARTGTCGSDTPDG